MFDPAQLVAAVIAISFAAGLNVYATVLALGAMQRMHWITLPSGLDMLPNYWIMAACGLLYLAEFFADKIPVFDLFWNVAHTFVRLPVAALLAYGAASHLTPIQQAAVAALGAAIAAIAHGSKVTVRAAATASPEPISNIALSSSEDVAALGLSWVATAHPLVGGAIAASLTVIAIVAIYLSLRIAVKAFRFTWVRACSIFKPGSVARMRSASSSRI